MVVVVGVVMSIVVTRSGRPRGCCLFMLWHGYGCTVSRLDFCGTATLALGVKIKG